jgi:hypothetical protein
VTLRLESQRGQDVADRQRRQATLGVVAVLGLRLVVDRFLVRRKESPEGDPGALHR